MMDIALNQWCGECEVLRETLSELKSAYAHQMNIICGLKEKIIPTDQLIIDVYTKQEENQALLRSLEISKRLCEDLTQQLHSTLAQVEPLREAKDKLDRHIQRCDKDRERLKADIDSNKISQQQLKAACDSLQEKLKKAEEDKKEAVANFKKIEVRLKRCQDEFAARKSDLSELKKENVALCNEISELKLEVELSKLHENSSSALSENVESDWSNNHLVRSGICHPDDLLKESRNNFDIAELFDSDLLKPLHPLISPLASPVTADLELSDDGSCSSNDGNISIDHYTKLLESELHLSKDRSQLQVDTAQDEIFNEMKDIDDKDGSEINIPKEFILESVKNLDSVQLVSQLSMGFKVSCDLDLLSTSDSVNNCIVSALPTETLSPHLNTLEMEPALSDCPPSFPLSQLLSHSIDATGFSEQLDCSEKHAEETQKISVDEASLSFSCNSRVSLVSLCLTNCSSNSSSSAVPSLAHDTNLPHISGAGLSSAVNVVSVISKPICFPSVATCDVSNTLISSDKLPLPDVVVAIPSSCITCAGNNVSSHAGSCQVASLSSSVSSSDLSCINDRVLSSAITSDELKYGSTNELLHSSASVGIDSGIANGLLMSTASNMHTLSSNLDNFQSTEFSSCDFTATPITDRLLSNVSESDDVPFLTKIVTAASSVCSTVPLCSASSSPSSIAGASTAPNLYLNTTPVLCLSTAVVCSLTSSASSGNPVTTSCSSSSLISVSEACDNGDPVSLDATTSRVDFDPIATSASEVTIYPNVSSDSDKHLLILLDGIFEDLKVRSPLSPLLPKCDDAGSSTSLCSSSLGPSIPSISLDSNLIIEGMRTRRKSYLSKSALIAADRNAECSDLGTSSKSDERMNSEQDMLPSDSSIKVNSKSRKCKRSKSILSLANDSRIVSSALSDAAGMAKTSGEKRKITESDSHSRETKICRSLRSNTIIESPVQKDTSAKIKGNSKNMSLSQKSLGKVTQKVIEPSTDASASDDLVSLCSSTSTEVMALIKKTLQLNEDLVSLWYNRSRTGVTPETMSLVTPSQEKVAAECRNLSECLIKEFCDQASQILGCKNENTQMNKNMTLCCVFVSLCRVLGDYGRVRTFVYEAIKQQYCGYCSLILCVAAVWPQSLQHSHGSDVAFPLADVLQYVICTKALNASTPKKERIKFCLEMFCGWKVIRDTADVIAQRILGQLEENLQQKSASSEVFILSVEMSLNLLSVTEGWQWSNNFLVIQLLWPVLSSWAIDSKTKTEAFVEAVVGILGSIMCNCPTTCKSNTDQVIDVLLALLQESSVAVSIQLAVLQSLLLLTKFQPDRCATMCVQWVEGHKEHIDFKTKKLLKDYHRCFSSELKYLSQLSIDP